MGSNLDPLQIKNTMRCEVTCAGAADNAVVNIRAAVHCDLQTVMCVVMLS